MILLLYNIIFNICHIMSNIINEYISDPTLEKCIVDFYPHIQLNFKTGGFLINETCDELKIPNIGITEENVTEYIHRDKKLIIYESGNKEYLSINQKSNKINNGLFIVSKIDNIDPNRFPILKNYDNICKKNIITYDNKYFTTSLIHESYSENNKDKNIKYIQISFIITNDERFNIHLIKHFKEVVSSLQNK